MTLLLDAALELAAAGYSVIPIKTDGSKVPAIPWQAHTRRPADEATIRTWWTTNPDFDLGVVQGAVSGNAELTELEGRVATRLTELRDLAHDTGLGDLWDLITTRGWVERSPSGGFHFHYRLDGPVPGNTKLARDATMQVLAETRGEGGQVVVAPSRHHPTGHPWVRLIGDPATAPTLTLEQRDAFHAILRTLDEQPEPTTPARPVAPRDPSDGITPGDDYETKVDWADLLPAHGWTHVTTRGRTRYWRRPGKNTGISATTGRADDRDRLYVFTSSTAFAQEVPYTKLGAYAVLEYDGDLQAAARELYAVGYGRRAEQRRPADVVDQAAETADTATLLGARIPAAPAGPANPNPQPTHTSTPTATVTTAPATYTETDDGNALRLIDTHGAVLRHVPQRGLWLTWDGHRWRWDEAGHVNELARAIARALPATDRESRTHRAKSLSRRGLEAMVAVARTDPRTVTHIAHLDARPYELNTPAGVINLRTGTLTPPDPARLHTRSTTVAPNLLATPTRWLDFLADTFAGDPALTTYVQRLLGVSLVGTVLEQLLPFAHGPGANGKTTLLGVVMRLLGIGDNGYAITAPAELLLATHTQGHPTEIARLSGARVVVSSELEEGQRFAEARIKQLTGRDVISGRFMRQDWFSFTPTHTLWLLANHQPEVRTGGPAFWRRLRLLPFEHAVPEAKQNPHLEDELVEHEGPAILGWLVAGARDYFTHRLTEPASVRTATATYAGDQDTVGRFVAEECETGDPNAQHMHARVTEVRAAYERWCRLEGEEPVSHKALTTALRTRFGVIPGRDATARYYDGIRLANPSPGDDDQSRPGPAWEQEPGW